MLDLSQIPSLHDHAVAHWHGSASLVRNAQNNWEELVLRQHTANIELWHQEDSARDPVASDKEIARVKRAIDRLNQERNDLAEAVDVWLFERVGEQSTEAPLHSETPGLIIDRLSILSLKLYHTEEQTQRTDAAEAHRSRNRERLVVLQRQRADLATCLLQLWSDICAGRRRFQLYRQMKMYNDPTLNPVLYRERSAP